MSDVEKSISERLNEEKWTRATLNNYTINNLKELDSDIERVFEDGKESEVRELCDEHLHHTKNSIVALYMSGIIAISKQQVDDTNIVTLIHIFKDNRKWNIVEFLCLRILDFGENKLALRTLAECYENENEDDKKYEIWERLIRVDYEEADIVRALAEKKEADDDIKSAIDYYKKSIHRFIGKKLFANVKEMYHKLIEYCPEDTDFFFHVDSKIAKTISPERASQLLEDLYEYYKEQSDWDRGIDILKRILDYDAKNQSARSEITECYKEKFADHSQLDEYVRLSNLNQNWRNVHEAIEDFEKHISFDKGNFVCHRSWGVGLISSIEGDEITIDFARKRAHKMSLKMAVSALSSLTRDHIWVLRTIWSKAKLHDKVKEDTKWALATVIRSHNNAANMKMIKAEIAPGILTAGEWSSWSTEARKILKTDPDFGNHPNMLDHYVVRENPISYEEKTFNRFSAEKDFFGRLKTIQEFLANADPESEFFGEMFDYFASFLKSFSVVNEVVMASFLLVQIIVRQYPFLNPGIELDFQELYEQIEDPEAIFAKIDDSDLKHEFLKQLQSVPDWPDIYVALFPSYLNKYIIEELEAGKHAEQLELLVLRMAENYREYREGFVWLARNVDRPWLAKFSIQYEKILIGMIHLLDISYREIENRRDVSDNRRLNRQIQTYLFKDDELSLYLDDADEDSINRIYTLVEDVKELDRSIALEFRQKITDRFPDFKFYSGRPVAESVSMGLLVTASSYERHRQELQHILDVEVPQNSKDIGAAIEMGDLRENAEYKAAKEKQDMLNSTVAKLKDEIDRAKIFDEKDIDSSKVSFGTKVSLVNRETDGDEVYTILGPWESNPSDNIISYLSPFGNALWNHAPGDELEFEINDRKYEYTINEITPVSFEEITV